MFVAVDRLAEVYLQYFTVAMLLVKYYLILHFKELFYRMAEKKCAFFIIDYSVTGGVERVTSNLSRLFFQNNLPFDQLISLHSKNEIAEISFPDHLKVTVLTKGEKIDVEKALYDVLKENNIGTLIFQGDNMTTTLNILKAAKRADCRAILHYHGSPYAYLKKYIYWNDIVNNPVNIIKVLWSWCVYPFKKSKLKKVIQNATGGFVSVSKGVQEELIDLFSLTENLKDRITSIPNPLTFKTESNTHFEKENNIVYVSRLTRKHKNSMMAVKAWQRLEKNYPHWHLYILGDGTLRNKMEAYCAEQKIEHIYFEGTVADVKPYLERSSISLLTSDCEGLGMGLLESAAYKNALVVTRADGGVTDIVIDGVTGYLSPTQDDKLFAEKLSILLEDENARITMGENAFKKLDDFSDEKIISLWKKLLDKK
jgi:glycosyltransferase involved in cell wall biosynthesis